MRWTTAAPSVPETISFKVTRLPCKCLQLPLQTSDVGRRSWTPLPTAAAAPTPAGTTEATGTGSVKIVS
jgi:hypothetical protein